MKKTAVRVLAGLCVVVPLAVLAACGGSSTSPANFDMSSVSFAPSLGVDLSQMTNLGDQLYVQDIQAGDGTLMATTGDSVTVDYEGWLPNGTLFDSSLQRGQPLVFHLGLDSFITGFTKGIMGMTTGSIRLIVIPPALGYGSQGAGGVIPPNSALVFKVWLRDLKRVGVPSTQASGAGEGS